MNGLFFGPSMSATTPIRLLFLLNTRAFGFGAFSQRIIAKPEADLPITDPNKRILSTQNNKLFIVWLEDLYKCTPKKLVCVQ